MKRPRIRPTRAQLAARLPITQAFVQSLTVDTIDKLELVHRGNLADLISTTVTEGAVYDWYRGVLTTWIAADLGDAGEPEMAVVAERARALCERWEANGRLDLTPLEIEALTHDIDVMRAVAQTVSVIAMTAAVDASEAAVDRLVESRRAARLRMPTPVIAGQQPIAS